MIGEDALNNIKEERDDDGSLNEHYENGDSQETATDLRVRPNRDGDTTDDEATRGESSLKMNGGNVRIQNYDEMGTNSELLEISSCLSRVEIVGKTKKLMRANLNWNQ